MAEELGYDGFALYDVPSRPALECWTTLACCLGGTERLLGVPLVLSNALRHPALLAKMAWDLHALTEGRLVLGLGAGGDDRDLQAFGLPPSALGTRLDQLDEGLALIRRLFTGDPVWHRGRFYRVDGLHLQQEVPPPWLLVGGHGRRLLRIAARRADAVNVGVDLSPEQWTSIRDGLLAERARAGPDASPLLLTHNARMTTPTLPHLDELIREGVSWFFLVFADLPGTRLLRQFAAEVLPRFRHG